MTLPLVSIIIPVYNREHLLGATLDSILQQSYPNWECLLVDDGSTDASWDVMLHYQKLDNRFKTYRRGSEHLPGGSGARNFGFEKSEGEYINWFDSDDLMFPNHLEKKVAALQANPMAEMVFCSCLHFTENLENTGKIWHVESSNLLEDEVTDRVSIQTALPMFRRSYLETDSLFPEHIHMAEEWVLMCRLLLKKPTWVNINEPLIYYRVHEVQKLKTLNRTMLESEYLARLEVYRMLREHRFFTPAVHAFYSKVMIRLIRKSIQIRRTAFSMKPLGFILLRLLPGYRCSAWHSLRFLMEYVLFILAGRSGLRWSLAFFRNENNLR